MSFPEGERLVREAVQLSADGWAAPNAGFVGLQHRNRHVSPALTVPKRKAEATLPLTTLLGRAKDGPGLLDLACVVQVQNVDDLPAPALLLRLE